MQPPRRWSPLSRIVIAAIIFPFAVAGFWTFINYDQKVPVLIAKPDLPAYHALTSSDVTLGTIRAQDASEYAGLPVDGRLTLTAIKSGSPLRASDLSPVITTAFRGGFAVVGLDVSRAGALGGAMSDGDPVKLLLARQGAQNGELKAVVMSVSRDGPQASRYTLVVAVGIEDARLLSSALSSGSQVVVMRDPNQR